MADNRKKDNVFFSADDFGISKLANVNILALLEKGKLDRVAVMISENLSSDDVRKLKNSGAKIDIHLHLVKQGSDYWRGNRLLREGIAKRVFCFFLNFFSGKASPQKVALRWAVQIEKFREIFGKNPDGIGSHEYIHYFPPYLKETIRLAKKYQIPYLRFGINDFTCERRPVAQVINWLRKQTRGQVAESNLETTDHMFSFDWFGNLDFLENLPTKTTVEIVFHPEREDEFEFLAKREIDSRLDNGMKA